MKSFFPCLCCLLLLGGASPAQKPGPITAVQTSPGPATKRPGANTQAAATDTEALPEWAYRTGPAEALKPRPALSPEQRAAADNAPQHLAGTNLTFTRKEANDVYHPSDWFPQDHGPMPAIVAQGRRPASIWACALCHLPNGKGKPENAPVAGLPVSYFVHQMQDFRDGNRQSADKRKGNSRMMAAFAKAMTDEEIQQSAEYFGAISWSSGTNPWVKVVETDTVPRTHLSSGLYIPNEGADAGTEPLGRRLIEVPEHPDRTEVQRDPHSGFIAYVPFDTLAKGKALVEKGGAGVTEACAVCHGVGLQGLGPVPGIAGRPATYMARQLLDIQHGTRKGEWSQLMKPVVAHLTTEQILQISAYTASLPPASVTPERR